MLSESAHMQPQHWPKQPQHAHAYALMVSASAAAASGDICIDGLQVYILEQAQHENRVDTKLVQTRKRSARAPGSGVHNFMFAFSEAGCRDSLQGT